MIWTIFIVVIFIGILIYCYLVNGFDNEFWQILVSSFVVGTVIWFTGLLLGIVIMDSVCEIPLKKVYLKEKV